MWPDVIVAGLTSGSLYCLVAVGFNVLYRPTKVFNFAQGDFVMVGAMASALLMTQLKWSWVPAFAAAMAGVALLSLVVERVAVAPVLKRSTNGTAWIITTLAIAMIMTNVVGKIWGADPIVVNAPAPLSNDMLTWGSLNISSYQIALIVLTVLLVVVVELLYGSLWGKAAIAVSEDRDAALLRGIDPTSISRWSFALGGAFAGLTGALASPVLSASTSLGGMLLLKGFAAAAIGGLGSNRGALIAGYAIGLSEAASALLLSPGYHNAVMLVLVLAILLVRPGGLFSSLEARTV
ncbi:branched-chain amino acid ABC transporter permease [Variovorax sp. GT1P44]|uniref:branched-chain amino acid ABC transporter permease n=1 Tax=Variovorax sp. GT1P44 TaxID=3443742 RepID=UPI003F470E40